MDDPISCIIDNYPTLTQPTFYPHSLDHGVQHHILTSSPSVFYRTHHHSRSPNYFWVAKKEFMLMLEMGIISLQQPMVIIPAILPIITASWILILPLTAILCLTGFYRHVHFLKDRPHQRLSPNSCRPSRYLQNCYHYLLRQFEFLCMPFGLRNASQPS